MINSRAFGLAHSARELDTDVPRPGMEATPELPWLPLEEAARRLGMTIKSAHNCLLYETFPVPTYKIGKRRVVDRLVLDHFFEMKRADGLEQLKKSGVGRR